MHGWGEEKTSDKPNGAWFLFAYDTQAYPIGLFATEIEALRHMAQLGYGNVKFWEFGKEWADVVV